MRTQQHDGSDHKQTPLYKQRHSLAHILAQAVQKMRPGTLLGFGPPVDNGFYYDFILPEPITEEDFPALEKEMRRIIGQGQQFQREDLPADEALERLEQMREPHKIEYARELIEQGNDSLSFYTNGPFVDMCEGPHVENTRQIPADSFKLSNVAGAYWRGDERNQMMTRIYGLAFPTKAELKDYIARRELAMQRDHRKLGAQLDIFVIDEEIGKGLALWLPNGAVLCHELEKLAMEMEFKAGYERVLTPHITREGLYMTSGHLTHYKTDMYPPMLLDEDDAQDGEGGKHAYYLKPMNCPHHHKIFAARPRSYRDLPLRLAEYGMCYRYEKSGQLQGLTRVRGLHMNDAHIYCTREQAKEEFKAVMELHRKLYELFGFADYFMRLSLRDPDDTNQKYVQDAEAWDFTEQIVQEAMHELGVDYVIQRGEAAFYGPKVDIQFRTVIEREFTVSTNQLDFAIPPRFGLTYTGPDGEPHTPLCIHRAPLGTHERFVAFLIEHYGGAFPTWLAPVQVRILPVGAHFLEYAQRLNADLRQQLVRSEVDDSDETLGKKIRLGATRKIPILLVVGEKEQADQTVTVRRYGIKRQQTMSFEAFQKVLTDEIRERRHVKE